jgi:hypothetical protein
VGGVAVYMLVVTGNGGRRPYTIKLYNNFLIKHNRLAFIVDYKSPIMNLLFLSTGMVILVTATFLLTNTFNTTTAYGCIKSSGTNHTAGINGISGNLTKSALTSSSQILGVTFALHKVYQFNNCKSFGDNLSDLD